MQVKKRMLSNWEELIWNSLIMEHLYVQGGIMKNVIVIFTLPQGFQKIKIILKLKLQKLSKRKKY